MKQVENARKFIRKFSELQRQSHHKQSQIIPSSVASQTSTQMAVLSQENGPTKSTRSSQNSLESTDISTKSPEISDRPTKPPKASFKPESLPKTKKSQRPEFFGERGRASSPSVGKIFNFPEKIA
eukprot:221108_1